MKGKGANKEFKFKKLVCGYLGTVTLRTVQNIPWSHTSRGVECRVSTHQFLSVTGGGAVGPLAARDEA